MSCAVCQRRGARRREQPLAGESGKTAVLIGSACTYEQGCSSNSCAAMLSAGAALPSELQPDRRASSCQAGNIPKVAAGYATSSAARGQGTCQRQSGDVLQRPLMASQFVICCRGKRLQGQGTSSCLAGDCKQADDLRRRQVRQAQAAVHTCAGRAQRRQLGSAWAPVIVHRHDLHQSQGRAALCKGPRSQLA